MRPAIKSFTAFVGIPFPYNFIDNYAIYLLDYLSEERDICHKRFFVFGGTQKSLFGAKTSASLFLFRTGLISMIFAIVPGIGLAVFIYTIDDHEPEPVNLLILSFILGMASFAFSLIPKKFLNHLVDGIHNLLRVRAVHAFASVDFIEEVSKFAIVRGIL